MRRKQILLLSALTVLILSCLCPATNIAEQISDQFAPQEPIEVIEQLPSETPVIEKVIQDSPDTLIYRANLARTGVYQSPGPKQTPGLFWEFIAEDSIYSSPAIFNGVAYFGSSDSHLYAVDITTGEALWHYQTGDAITSSPAIADGMVFFGSKDGGLYALNPSSGEALWIFQTGDMITSSPAVSDGKVYFGSWDGFLYALNVQTGEEVWKFEVDGFNNRTDGLYKGVSSSPALSDGVIFFGSNQMGGASKELFFYALDAETGEKLWAYSSWNAITSPAVLDRRVYFGGFFEFKGLDIDQGTEVISIGYDTFTITPPAMLDGMAYFGCDFGLLHAVDVNTGTEKWNTFSGDASAISRAPSVADGVVYFSSGHGFLIALDIQTNQILWEYEVGVSITTSPVILDGVIYIGTKEGQLFALEAP